MTRADASGEPADGLYSLVYTSFAVTLFDESELEELLTQSRAANAQADITGMLLYRNGRFIQYLEGPELPVRALLARITADPRHADVRVLVDSRPPARQLAEWTMGYEPIDEARTALPAGFRSTFDDLEAVNDADPVLRATRELSLWFRVRQARPRVAAT